MIRPGPVESVLQRDRPSLQKVDRGSIKQPSEHRRWRVRSKQRRPPVVTGNPRPFERTPTALRHWVGISADGVPIRWADGVHETEVPYSPSATEDFRGRAHTTATPLPTGEPGPSRCRDTTAVRMVVSNRLISELSYCPRADSLQLQHATPRSGVRSVPLSTVDCRRCRIRARPDGRVLHSGGDRQQHALRFINISNVQDQN